MKHRDMTKTQSKRKRDMEREGARDKTCWGD